MPKYLRIALAAFSFSVASAYAQQPGGFRKEKRDFWHLYRLKRLPAETLDYVPRVLAAAVVCGDPVRYGLEPPPRGSP